ncbi:hypothetical protein Taro_049893 [Colocasia esculenta]|uniref:Cyclin-like domain-containing protein n=1 Tax=Colocasia esculenta TaxID=4460 RepID=A0A843XCD6_COLES|nr:hypothetical protein [Colocasia esculenta]
MDQCTSLLCDEELLCTPTSSPGAASTRTFQSQYTHSAAVTCRGSDQDADGYLRACVTKQHRFVPRGGYVRKLRRCPELSGFRHKALIWIMTVRVRLDLSFGTAFSAVNYLDRFVSLYTNMKWEAWMMELLSVASLSIAAKFDEVLVPSLHDLPVEDLDHSFDPSAIQRMELAVLRALDWSLNCVTAHSFVGPLTSLLDSGHHLRLRRAVADRVIELLVGAACDVELVESKPSSIALSALRCALEELAPVESHGYLAVLAHLESPQEHILEELEECHGRMEERVADPVYSPTAAASGNHHHPYAAPSPVTVVTPEIHEAVDWIVDVGIFLKVGVHVVSEEQLFCEPKKSREKRKEMGSSMQEKGPSSS